jgi:hypothetical protein
MFTKKNYEKVAKSINELGETEYREKITTLFEELFEEDNENFDKDKFREATRMKQKTKDL